MALSGRIRRALLAVLVAAFGQGAVATENPPPDATEPSLVVSETRLSARDTGLKLELEFDRTPGFTLHYVDAPPRLIIDLPRTIFAKPDGSVGAQGLVKAVRYGTMAEGSARMVVTLKQPVRVTRSEARGPRSGKPPVLVLEGEKVGADEFRRLVASQTWSDPHEADTAPDALALTGGGETGGVFAIAVDAGHGGIDTGATSPDGKTVEKDITLAFARDLVDRLNREAGIRAFLTREKDEFISLSRRVQIARQRKANLFISFHADKLKQNSIRGATVYTISDRASDSLTANLAERENLSDELAGLNVSDEPEEVADILLDLTRRETQAFSVTFAQSVIQSFKGQIELINNPHRSAGFLVLGAPEIPSILLELGFLSNKKDEALLTDARRREKIAVLLTAAIREYRQPAAAAAGGQGG